MVRAIRGLEQSLAANRPRALIQMASGAGKTFTACNFSYRLIKHAGARRILFLVDRNTLGEQTLREFQAFVTPDDRRKFVELYNVQHIQTNHLDDVSKVCITTIQRLYSIPNVQKGCIDLQDLKHASSDGAKSDSDALIPGDFLVIRTNGSKDLIGRAALIGQPFDNPPFLRFVPDQVSIRQFDRSSTVGGTGMGFIL